MKKLHDARSRFCNVEDGAIAIEFALIAPLLIFLLVAVIEAPRMIATGRRVAQATTAMTTIISRGDFGELSDVYGAAQVIAAPYDIRNANIVLTTGGIYQIGSSNVAKACSSVSRNDKARAAGSTIGVPPPGTSEKGDRFVMVETEFRYEALFKFLPAIDGWTFRYTRTLPVREGPSFNGQSEVVLPGGQPCPM